MKLSLSIKSWWLIALASVLPVYGLIAGGELNIYSHRHYAVDEDINRLFTEETGIRVNVVNAHADQLIERLKSEGERSPADLLITVDAGRLQRAKAEGLLQALHSDKLDRLTPAKLRDPEGFWYPYTLRARVIIAAGDRVDVDQLRDYADLADPRWRGRLLIRSSSNAYNQALLASVIAAEGEVAATEWARGVVANFARPPQGSDRDQIRAVANGLADICVSNTYYLGMLLNSNDHVERERVGRLTVIFPNQQGRGTHVNIGGAGVTRHAKNIDNARRYLEFLLSPEVQQLIANGSYEYPVSLNLELNPLHRSWGTFKLDDETFSQLGDNELAAVRVFDAVGWR